MSKKGLICLGGLISVDAAGEDAKKIKTRTAGSVQKPKSWGFRRNSLFNSGRGSGKTIPRAENRQVGCIKIIKEYYVAARPKSWNWFN